MNFGVEPNAAYFPAFSDNKVGSEITIEFKFTITSQLFEKDYLELKFPDEFVFPPS